MTPEPVDLERLQAMYADYPKQYTATKHALYDAWPAILAELTARRSNEWICPRCGIRQQEGKHDAPDF